MSGDSDDDWETADIDARLEEQLKSKLKVEEKERKILEKQQQNPAGDEQQFMAFDQEDGNYRNNAKPHNGSSHDSQSQAKFSGAKKKFPELVVQPYPFKDIEKIRSYTEDPASFEKLFLSTFGEFERFIESHGQKTPEILVNLLIIDVTLLESPFRAHNRWLLSHLIRIDQFWTKLMNFIEGFFEEKWKDHTFMLTIDVAGFFRNLVLLLGNLIAENVYEEKIRKFYETIVELMKKYPENPHNCVDKIEKLLELYKGNNEFLEQYSVYPTLHDLNSPAKADKSKKNLVNGKYDSVEQYLDIQLGFLRSEIMNELRDCALILKSRDGELNPRENTQISKNYMVYPRVRIHKSEERSKYFSITIVPFTSVDFTNRFFNGQMLLLSTSTEMKDLVVAIVISSRNEKQEVKVKIVKSENIDNIYKRDMIMIEPVTFYFEPFYRVKEILQNFNEFTFPFQSQILRFENSSERPSYLSAAEKSFTYNLLELDINNTDQWPNAQQLLLESQQVQGIKKALTTEFSLIQGPPGTGKTFIGVEILKILLQNTKQRVSIITHTNNALDRFLLSAHKAIAKFAVRLGSQSKNAEAIADFAPKHEFLQEMKNYARKVQTMFQAEIERLESDDEIFEKYCLMTELTDEAFQLNKFLNINNKRVFGMTTSFAARNTSLNHLLKSGIVIVEEASEVLESHLIAALTKHTKHVIMIGDQQQLRPHCSVYSKGKGFEISMFERLIDNKYPYTKLDVQRRMRPEISELLRLTIHSDLQDSDDVLKLPDVKGMEANLFCLSHNQPHSKQSGESSCKNDFEADKIVELTKRLLKIGYSTHDIKILTCYDAQVKKIEEALKKSPGRSLNVRVVTTDSYQGEESNIIILSLVRSSDSSDLGFMNDMHRSCVMLSRAKIGFYIVGNIEMFAKKSKMWKKVHDYLKDHDMIGAEFPMGS